MITISQQLQDDIDATLDALSAAAFNGYCTNWIGYDVYPHQVVVYFEDNTQVVYTY